MPKKTEEKQAEEGAAAQAAANTERFRDSVTNPDMPTNLKDALGNRDFGDRYCT